MVNTEESDDSDSDIPDSDASTLDLVNDLIDDPEFISRGSMFKLLTWRKRKWSPWRYPPCNHKCVHPNICFSYIPLCHSWCSQNFIRWEPTYAWECDQPRYQPFIPWSVKICTDTSYCWMAIRISNWRLHHVLHSLWPVLETSQPKDSWQASIIMWPAQLCRSFVDIKASQWWPHQAHTSQNPTIC